MSMSSVSRAALAGFCLALAGSPAATLSAAEQPVVRAPDFMAQVLDATRAERALSDIAKGKVVLLNFWASWCYPCRIEMPEFQKIHDRFKERGFSVVAVAVYDEFDQALAVQEESRFTYPLLFDHAEQAKKAFSVEVVPLTYLIGRDGNLVPIPNPKTGQAKIVVNDPTIWVQPETFDFIEQVVSRE